jgi:hypothetical protein
MGSAPVAGFNIAGNWPTAPLGKVSVHVASGTGIANIATQAVQVFEAGTDSTSASTVRTAGARAYNDSTGVAALSLGTKITGGAFLDTVVIRETGCVAVAKTACSTALDVNGTATATAFSGPLTGAVTGNASTATALATPRAINGVNFDGTAAITIAAPTWTKFSWTNAQITALGASHSGDVTITTLNAKQIVDAMVVSITGQGAASGSTFLVLRAGGAANELVSFGLDIKAAAGTFYSSVATGIDGSAISGGDGLGWLPSMTGTTAVKLHFASDVNLSTVTGSSGDVYLRIVTLP